VRRGAAVSESEAPRVLHVFLLRLVVLAVARRVRGCGLSAGWGCWPVSAAAWWSCSVSR
jgi:hypothetical protein